jgi:ABC-type transporter Mla maintaining outer membrane lipid asymmetry ATPase subunit MlaF
MSTFAGEYGAAVLTAEQHARAVRAISDRTYVLGGGELRMKGTPAELSSSPEFVHSFLGGGPNKAVQTGDADSVRRTAIATDTLTVRPAT